jgi:valyl-tRNA synthetase
MLADVAVAVHPSDTRYAGLVGKPLLLPLLNREIPLITDIYPDPAFGSGAVKITPAHDANDYEVGVRNHLEMPVLLTEDGRITDAGGRYAGLDRFEARKRIVADLESGDYLEKIEDYDIPVLVSERSGEVIEPLLSEQWFVRQTDLARKGVDAVEVGGIRFYPERYNAIFIDWMKNIRDWCISRQLWWGHRIPVYYDEEGAPYAALTWDEAQKKAADKKIVRQDDDVLDTWFSSGLWPFATLGWPERTADLQARYPTDVLITDRNIVNLWVARMVMMGFDQMREKPFREVMIYATVLNERGQRMSKSLGTGVDPMAILEKVGADALRYTLMSQTGANQDLRYSEKRTEEARNFCNKIWNATRFVLMNQDGIAPSKPEAFEDADLWLLSRLAEAEESARMGYAAYDLQTVCQSLYRFFWSELCDWYIEVTKHRLADPASRSVPQWVLLKAIEAFLTMLHPVMPFLTEEIYSYLPLNDKSEFLMGAKWPSWAQEFRNPAAEARIQRAFEIVREFRALRHDLEITPREPIPVVYYEGDMRGAEPLIRSQAWIVEMKPGTPPAGRYFSSSSDGVDLHLPLGGLLDPTKLLASTEREITKVGEELQKIEVRLNDPSFRERAKREVVDRDRVQAEELRESLRKLSYRMSLLENE